MNKKKKLFKVASVYLDPEIFRKLKIVAANKDVRVNDCMVEALMEYLKKNKEFLKGGLE